MGGSNLRFGGLWTAVIIVQIALSVTILPRTVYMGREALRHKAGGFGFPAEEYLSVRLGMDWERPSGALADTYEAAFQTRFARVQQELKRRLAGAAGVSAVTFASRLPGMDHPGVWGELYGEAVAPGADRMRARIAYVDADFFDAFDTPVLSGRAFQSSDLQSDADVVIVNQSFVRKFFGPQNAIGRRVRSSSQSGQKPGQWYEILGIVNDLDMNPMTPGEGAGFYLPSAPGRATTIHMAVRVGRSAESFGPRLRSIIAEVDPTVQLYDIMSLKDVGSPERLSTMAFTSLFALLAATALLLSAAGTYALMSFTVSRRTREIGIRAALGGRPGVSWRRSSRGPSCNSGSACSLVA